MPPSVVGYPTNWGIGVPIVRYPPPFAQYYGSYQSNNTLPIFREREKTPDSMTQAAEPRKASSFVGGCAVRYGTRGVTSYVYLVLKRASALAFW
ncbi:unnamed protein product [Soboliphyme baturini]|uniref:Uncharacterized protein n=1 Tax=Soboliphyme baturini TaxID=241478 RepID=A0A183IWY1_9BILA|nr:unnamed protein product [Soboliphyme baturini]